MDRTGKLAGFFTQIRVVFYKNLLLYKSNKLGIVFELLFISLSAVLFLISKNAFATKHPASTYTTEPIDFSYIQPFRTEVFYYPNNRFIEGVVINSFKEFQKSPKNSFFQDNMEFKFVAANQPVPEFVNKTWISSTLVFISFAANLTSYENFQPPLTYTLFTPE